MKTVNIVETRANYLSPFSAHSIHIWGELFPTVEHAYQSAKFIQGEVRESIKHSTSPLEAWRIAQQYKKNTDILQEDFNKDAVMEELFRAKMDQHPDISLILKELDWVEILKVYDTDYYWGTWHDGLGQNKMWKLWMKLREEIL